jgi:putative aldouronate transport system substrate-binding protein
LRISLSSEIFCKRINTGGCKNVNSRLKAIAFEYIKKNKRRIFMKGKSKFIKTVALVCALLMFVTLFAGCGSGTGTAKDESVTTSTASTAQAEASTVTDPFAKHFKYTMSVIDADKTGKDQDGKIAANYEWFCKKFNIEFEFLPLTWDNYVDQTRLWLASGGAPDLMMLDIAPVRYAEYLNWVKQGLFKAYPDISKYSNLKQKMDKMVTGQKFIVDGKMYAWPAYIDLEKYNFQQVGGFTYRIDWAEKVGLRNPNDEYTWDEWLNLVKTVLEKDPQGNGKGKTIGMIGTDWSFPKDFGPGTLSPNITQYGKGSDGKWAWGPALPESLEAVKLTKKMYDDGLIWKDQIMAKNDDMTNKFYANLLFAQVTGNENVGGLDIVQKDYKKANPDADTSKVIGFAFVHGPDGKIMSRQAGDQWSQEAMNAKLDDEKVERWTIALDWMVSDEGYYFRNLGIPETDWTMENGQAVAKWPKDASGNLVNPYANSGTWNWVRAAGCSDGFGLIDPGIPQWIKDLVTKASERVNQPDVNIIKLNPDLAFYNGPLYNKVGTKEKEIYQEIAKLMTSKNVEKDWNDWVKSKMVEIQPVLDEMNANLK